MEIKYNEERLMEESEVGEHESVKTNELENVLICTGVTISDNNDWSYIVGLNILE